MVMAAAVGVCAALLTGVSAAAQPPATGLAAPADANYTISVLSCPSGGNCGGAGYHVVAGGYQDAFVIGENNGSWGPPTRARGLATNEYDLISSISCGSAGNCSVVGNADGSSGQEAFLLAEKNGTWGRARPVPGLAQLTNKYASIISVSCGSAGNCSAGGWYTDHSGGTSAFVVTQTNGTWGPAQQVPGLAARNTQGAQILSVSCGSAGNCSAGGNYTDGSGGTQAFVVTQTNGSWRRAQQVPGLAARNTGENAWIGSVSCASAGNCSAGGWYTESSGGTQAFVVTQTNGSWGRAQQVPGLAALNTGGMAAIGSVSCASAGNCSADGGYSGRGAGAFVVTQTNGTWGRAQQVPGLARLGLPAGISALSCGSAGNCSAGGDDSVGGCCRSRAFVLSQVHGTWSRARPVPGLARFAASGISDVSCPSAGNCTAVGGFGRTDVPPPGPGYPFVVNSKDGIWGHYQTLPPHDP